VPSRMRFDDLSQAKPYDHVVVGNKDPCQVRSLSNAPLRQASTSRTSHPLGKPLVFLGLNTDLLGDGGRGSSAAWRCTTAVGGLPRATVPRIEGREMFNKPGYGFRPMRQERRADSEQHSRANAIATSP
jgi:hypothetical protein